MKKFILLIVLLFPFSYAQAECRYLSILAECLAEAEKGNPIAQFVLGTRYEQGECVDQDFPQAARWYRKAADQGDRDAQYRLGLMYLHGKGLEKDPLSACMWMEIASINGLEEARSEMASLSAEISQSTLLEARERAQAWLDAYKHGSDN